MERYKLVENGRTEYQLLIPQSKGMGKDAYMDFAVKTFNDALKISTGVTLSVVSEPTSKFVSLGNTEMLKRKNVTAEYGADGFAVKEIDGNLYLFGQSEYGVIWAVYGFLEITVGYKFFALDEIKIEKRKVIDITGLEIVHTPSIEHRAGVAFGLTDKDCEQGIPYATGLKSYYRAGIKLDGSNFWGAGESDWVHNHVQEYIQPKKYYKDHPDWFVLGKNDPKTKIEDLNLHIMQLCFSNTEMRDEFAKNLIEIIKKKEKSKYFMIGHEDDPAFCNCEKCQKRIKEIGKSGLHMDFLNDMARRVEAWRKENAPERKICVCGLAYEMNLSFEPPVKIENGECVPIDPCVVAEENLCMCFAPIFAPEHSRSVFHESNKNLIKILNNWKKVCKNFTVWLYYGSFRRNFEFVDGIYRIKEDIKFYKELGAKWLMLQTPRVKGAISFQTMTFYVYTSLAWDATKDTDELIEEFGQNYYKEGWVFVKKYFELFMDYYAKTRKRIEYLTDKPFMYSMCQRDTCPQGFWSLNLVYDASLLLDEAENAIKQARYSSEIEEKLLDRIELERMTLLHIQLEYFNLKISDYDEKRTINTYPKEKILELCDRFEEDIKKFDIPNVNGDGTALETVERWRERANTTPRFWEEQIYRQRKTFDCIGKVGE